MNPQQHTAPDAEDHDPGHGDTARPLNRPARWAFAAVEVAVAIGLVAVAVWAWGKASVPYRLPDYENPAIPDVVIRQSGPWTAAAVGAVLLAGVFLLDALRQMVLAARGGRRATAAPDRDTPAYGADDAPPDRDTPAYRGGDAPPDRDVPAYGADAAPSDRDVPAYREGTDERA